MKDGIYDYTDILEDMNITTEVCIVGSGCGGATLAKKLTDSGVDVVVLEQGGYYPSSKMDQNELNMAGKISAERNLASSHDGGNFLSYGQNIGGASVHYWADSYRTPDYKLEEWETVYGLKGHKYKDLVPAFEEIENNLNIHPAKDEYFNQMNTFIKQASSKLGWHGHHVPQARKGCLKSGHCMQGCLYDAKQSQMVTHIPTAIKQGARIFSDAKASKLNYSGSKVSSLDVEIIDRATNKPNGIKMNVKAKIFVVAAGGFNSSFFLLQQGFKKKLPMLGMHFSMNPSSVIHGIYKEEMISWRNIPAAYAIDEFLEKRYENSQYKEGGYMIMANQAHPSTLAVSVPGLGSEHADLMNNLPYLGGTISWMDDVPEELGEIKINNKGHRVVHYEYGEITRKVLKDSLKKQAELQFSVGVKELIVAGYQGIRLRSMKDLNNLDDVIYAAGGLFMAAPHPGGGCRMGENENTSVVDYDHRVHGFNNLFVSDSSVFPTSSGLDPSLTIMAFSYRAAESILHQLRSQ
jgi:choline dehydrogenase-like flavoprotein